MENIKIISIIDKKRRNEFEKMMKDKGVRFEILNDDEGVIYQIHNGSWDDFFDLKHKSDEIMDDYFAKRGRKTIALLLLFWIIVIIVTFLWL
jgi:hypothetical protein